MKNNQNIKIQLLTKIRIIFAIFYSLFLVLSFYIPILEVRFSRKYPWSELSDLFFKIPIFIIAGIAIGYYIIFNKKFFRKLFEPFVKSYKVLLVVMLLIILISGLFYAMMTGDATIYGAELWPAMTGLGAIRGFIFFIIFNIIMLIIRYFEVLRRHID